MATIPPGASTTTVAAPSKRPKAARDETPPPAEASEARNSRDPARLAALAGHADGRVRAAVAANALTPTDFHERFARDDDPRVHDALATNPALSDALLVRLSEDRNVSNGALFGNGERGAYLQRSSSAAGALLGLIAVVASLVDGISWLFGATDHGHPRLAPRDPRVLSATLVALVGVAWVWAASRFGRITVAHLRARSLVPRGWAWTTRLMLLALVVSQARFCAMIF